MKHNIKVGDIVTCIDAYGTEKVLTLNKNYKVRAVHDISFDLLLEGLNGNVTYFSFERFVLKSSEFHINKNFKVKPDWFLIDNKWHHCIWSVHKDTKSLFVDGSRVYVEPIETDVMGNHLDNPYKTGKMPLIPHYEGQDNYIDFNPCKNNNNMKEYTKKEKLGYIQLMLDSEKEAIYLCTRAKTLFIDRDRFKEFDEILKDNINRDGYLYYSYANIYLEYVTEMQGLQYLHETFAKEFNLKIRKQLLLDLKVIVEALPEDEYPLSWDDLKINKGYWISDNTIHHSISLSWNSINDNHDIVATEAQAKAIQVLPELLQLRDAYRKGWVPDYYAYDEKKYCIDYNNYNMQLSLNSVKLSVFSFQTEEVRDLFLDRFKDKLEIYFKGLI